MTGWQDMMYMIVYLCTLSACAEDHGLCPWMNAQNVAESFTYRSIDAPADFAIGG